MSGNKSAYENINLIHGSQSSITAEHINTLDYIIAYNKEETMR